MSDAHPQSVDGQEGEVFAAGSRGCLVPGFRRALRTNPREHLHKSGVRPRSTLLTEFESRHGYHLLFTVKGVMAIVPHVYPSAKLKPLKDFKTVTEILQVPHIIVATNSAPFNDMQGLIEYARKNPGKLNCASNGVGSQPHAGMETIARRLGLQITHVPYKGLPMTDLMAGVVQLQLEVSTTAIPNIKAGKIRALATSGPERIPALPDLPTLTEVRADPDPEGATGNSWHGVFAPAGTPDAIVARLTPRSSRS